MKKIFVDSCTFILLAKASVLELFSNNNIVMTTKNVYDEVLEGKKKLFPDALLLERLKNENKIKVTSLNSASTQKIMQDYAMGVGEASLISVAIKEKNVIIATDNMQGRKVANLMNIPLIGSLEIIVSLHKKNIITDEKAISALKILKEEGWFHSYLVEKVEEDIKWQK
jgi:predicted nucleic acid-binding protein